MNNGAKRILFLGLAGISYLSFAQDITYQNELGAGDMGTIGALFGFIWIFFLLLWLIGLGLFILWIFMLIHAAKHDINNKTTWIVLLCLLGFPVAVIYFFTERKRFNKTHIVTITPISVPTIIPMQPAEATPVQPTNIV